MSAVPHPRRRGLVPVVGEIAFMTLNFIVWGYGLLSLISDIKFYFTGQF